MRVAPDTPPAAQAQADGAAAAAAELLAAAVAAHAADPEEAARVEETIGKTVPQVAAMMMPLAADSKRQRRKDKKMWWCEKSDWKRHGGKELERLLKRNSKLGGAPVALLDARFLVSLAKAGGRLLRRQQIPKDAFISLAELRRMPWGLSLIHISEPTRPY